MVAALLVGDQNDQGSAMLGPPRAAPWGRRRSAYPGTGTESSGDVLCRAQFALRPKGPLRCQKDFWLTRRWLGACSGIWQPVDWIKIAFSLLHRLRGPGRSSMAVCATTNSSSFLRQPQEAAE